MCMDIEYKDIKYFEAEELKELFLSVEWASGNYPEKLAQAMKNSGSVFSAWSKGELIGLISTMDDSVMNAYVHYLLVKPPYQSKGIGKKLVNMMKDYYSDYLRIILIAYDNEVGFYQNCGFERGEGKTPMFITSLWT